MEHIKKAGVLTLVGLGLSLSACAIESAPENTGRYEHAREVCGDRSEWDYLICVRPDLSGLAIEVNRLRSELYYSDDPAKLEALKASDARALEVFEYCTREIGEPEDCADEAMQASADTILTRYPELQSEAR